MGGALVLPCVDHLNVKELKIHVGMVDDTLVSRARDQ